MINSPIINNLITLTGKFTATVVSQTDKKKSYQVDVTGPDTCTCKAYEFNGTCKHITFLKRKIGLE